MSNSGAGVAGGVRCGLGLAARWSGEACGKLGIGRVRVRALRRAGGEGGRRLGARCLGGGRLGRFGGGWDGCGAMLGRVRLGRAGQEPVGSRHCAPLLGSRRAILCGVYLLQLYVKPRWDPDASTHG